LLHITTMFGSYLVAYYYNVWFISCCILLQCLVYILLHITTMFGSYLVAYYYNVVVIAGM